MRTVGYTVFVVLFVFTGRVWSKNCVQQDQCKCTFDDGSGTVDLSPMGSQDPNNPL